ncbi:hypothetical protein J008_02576 [Cryptococcus neoformans]|nr:hypothetical protein J008_02576 [Cryptococcus neoformans var. grubii]
MDDNNPGGKIFPDTTMRVESKEGLSLVKDAYMRQMDVMYQWPNSLNPWQAGAIKSIFSNTALYDPRHPLHPGKEGITLYLGYDKTNRPRLLFSLKQVEYIQYYINAMRLSTPSWVEYYQRRAELIADGSQESLAELEEMGEPNYEDGKDDWVPIPDMVLPAELFIKIEEIYVQSHFHLGKINKQLEKDSKIAERHERNGMALPVFDSKRFDDILSLPIPDPNANPEQEKEKEKNKQIQDEKDQEKMAMKVRAQKEQEEKRRQEDADWREQEERVRKHREEMEREAIERERRVEREENGTGETLDKAAEFVDSEINDSSVNFVDEDERQDHEKISARYHNACQRALIIAMYGGWKYFDSEENGPQQEEDVDGVMEEEEKKVNKLEKPSHLGRTVFVALSVTRWEKDPKVVLEVGWSAIYWQEDKWYGPPDALHTKPEFEEMRDYGHIIVQDHILDKYNGETRPDYRDKYCYGDSIPIPKNELKQTLKAKLQDIWKKGGKGPIFIVTHTPKGEEHDFCDVGLDITTADPDLHPDTQEILPDEDPNASNAVYMVNTATLFGAIEGVESSYLPPSPSNPHPLVIAGRSEKSLQHAALIVFGNSDERRKPTFVGNAGNDAFYTLQLLLAILFGSTLDELKAAYEEDNINPDFFKASADPTRPDKIEEDKMELVRAAPSRPPGLEGYIEVDREDMLPDDERIIYDDPDWVEEEDVIGVHYEDDEGNLLPLPHGPDHVGSDEEERTNVLDAVEV